MIKRHIGMAGSVAAAALAFCSVAQAVNGPSLTFSVTGWNALTPSSTISSPNQQALPSNPLMIPANEFVTGTATGIPNWYVPGGGTNTFGAFTGGGSTSNSFTFWNGGSNSTLLSASGFSQTTILELTFSTYNTLSATITHDDGISLWNSSNTMDLFDASAPTTPQGTNIALAAGTYNLYYVEANGAPSQLTFSNVQEVPEPGALALFGAGLAGCALFISRRRRAAR